MTSGRGEYRCFSHSVKEKGGCDESRPRMEPCGTQKLRFLNDLQ